MSDTRTFFEAVWSGLDEDDRLMIATIPPAGGGASHYSATSAEQAMLLAERHKGKHVYLSCGLQPPGVNTRAKKTEAVGIFGLWADVDYEQGSSEIRAGGYPPTQADAHRIIADVGAKPTMVVHSGGGLQAWWLFTEKWSFDTPEERSLAERILRQWQETLKAIAAPYKIDSVSDLARIMRVPGTLNHKTDPPHPAKILSLSDQRWTVDDLEQFMVSDRFAGENPPSQVHVDVTTVRTDADIEHVHALCQENTDFKKVWEGKTTFPSPSERDLSVASHGVAAGWSDQEVTDAMVACRIRHNASLHRLHRLKISKTIGKAKEGKVHMAAVSEMASEDDGSIQISQEWRKELLAKLSKVFGCEIIRYIRMNEAGNARYALIIRADGSDETKEIDLGRAADAMTLRNIRAKFYDHAIDVKINAKRDWPVVNSILLRVAENVEGSSVNEVTLDWIDSYLASASTRRLVRDYDPNDPEDAQQAGYTAVSMGAPHLHYSGGVPYLALSLEKFISYLIKSHSIGSNTPRDVITKRLESVGFFNRRLRGQNKQYRRFWLCTASTIPAVDT